MSINVAPIFAEAVAPNDALRHADAWRSLSLRALEPNVFARPEFLIPALRHIGLADARIILVWRNAGRVALLGAIVMTPPGRLGFGVARVWLSEQAAAPAIMLDREGASAALAAALAHLRAAGIAGLAVPMLDAHGATAAALDAFAGESGLPLARIHPRRRAVLEAGATPPAKKRLKEWGRLRRRLAERGALRFVARRDGEALGSVDAFLALEAKGWKGVHGAPLGADPARAAFARAMLGEMAAAGALRIDALELDGAPIASGIMLRAGERAFYWKTAYDEGFAEYSPGLLLTLDLTDAQRADPSIARTDSCAIEGHPMIERLWPQRIDLVDTVIATRAGANLALWRSAEEGRRRLKDHAKRLLYPLLRRKRS